MYSSAADSFMLAMAWILRFVGEVTDNVADPGHPTKYGLSVPDLRESGSLSGVYDLTYPEAVGIYWNQHWTHADVNAHQVAGYSRKIAVYLFDSVALHGRSPGVSILQRALNLLGAYRSQQGQVDLLVDGHIGTKTLTALDAVLQADGEEEICAVMAALRLHLIEALITATPPFRVFARDWTARILSYPDIPNEE